MKKAIGFFLLFISQLMTTPVPILIDNFSTENVIGTSNTNGTIINITNSSTINFLDQSNPGNASINVDVNSIVNFVETSPTTYSGLLTGTGTINKIGTGNLTMTGNNSGFTGPLFVQVGTLFLNGAYGGNISVSPSATVVYNGPISGDLHVTGTIRTNGVNTLLVGGNYFQTANAIYIVDFNSNGQSSLINIAGTASLNGFVQVNVSQGILLNSLYKILHANGGITGTYGLINPYPLLLPIITYDANNVYVKFESNILSAAVTQNEQQVANQLFNLVPSTPDELLVISSLLTLTTSEAQKALNVLSGEQYSNFILSALYESSRFNKRIYNSVRDIQSCFCNCKKINNWISGGGGKGYQKGNEDTSGFHLSSWDLNTGMHACLNKDWLLGGALRYDEDFVYSNLGGKAIFQTGNASIYSLYHKKRFYFFSDLIGGISCGEFKRTINFGSINRSAHSDPFLSYGRLDLQIGADLNNLRYNFQPFIAGSCELYHQSRVKEKKAESLDLLINSINKELVSSQLGLHFGSNNNRNFLITLDLAWHHYYGNLRVSETTRFEDFGTSFKINGPKRGHDGGEGSLYLSKPFGSFSEVFLGAEGEVWKRWYSYEFNGGVCFRW